MTGDRRARGAKLWDVAEDAKIVVQLSVEELPQWAAVARLLKSIHCDVPAAESLTSIKAQHASNYPLGP